MAEVSKTKAWTTLDGDNKKFDEWFDSLTEEEILAVVLAYYVSNIGEQNAE